MAQHAGVESIDKTIRLLESADSKQLNGTEENTILLPMHDKTVAFKGLTYLVDFA